MSLILSPVSKVSVGPYSTTITTTNVLSPYSPYSPYAPYTPYVTVPSIVPVTPLLTTPYYAVEVETGLNEGYLAQKQMVDHMLYLVLDKWLYKDLCHILKYLKISDGKVEYISNADEYKNNKICSDSESDVEAKADFIENNILGKNEMRRLLKRMIDELGYKWYEFPLREQVVMDTVERYLKKHLKTKAGMRQ